MEKEDEIISMLDKIIGKLDEHSKKHEEHSRKFKEHGEILKALSYGQEQLLTESDGMKIVGAKEFEAFKEEINLLTTNQSHMGKEI